MKKRNYLTGKWITSSLVRISKPLPNGGKLIVIYGKCPPSIKPKLEKYGFRWNRIEQRWEKKTRRNKKLFPFLL